MHLKLHVREAEPYPIGEPPAYELADAIEEEATTCAADAGSDEIEDPSEETREAFKQNIIRDATRALQSPGDSYRDPFGTLWTLEP